MSNIVTFLKKILPEFGYILAVIITAIALQLWIFGYEQFSQETLQIPIEKTFWGLNNNYVIVGFCLLISFIVFSLRIWAFKHNNVATFVIALLSNMLFILFISSLWVSFSSFYATSDIGWVIYPPLSALPIEPPPRPLITYLTEALLCLQFIVLCITVAISILLGKKLKTQ